MRPGPRTCATSWWAAAGSSSDRQFTTLDWPALAGRPEPCRDLAAFCRRLRLAVLKRPLALRKNVIIIYKLGITHPGSRCHFTIKENQRPMARTPRPDPGVPRLPTPLPHHHSRGLAPGPRHHHLHHGVVGPAGPGGPGGLRRPGTLSLLHHLPPARTSWKSGVSFIPT